MSTKNEYMLLFTGSEWYNDLSATELKRVMEEGKAWFEKLIAQGKATPGHPLVRAGARVSAKTGQVTTDGPYPETKEAVGGYMIVQADSLEEATAIAKSNPMIRHGVTVDIRQIAEECPCFQRARELEQDLAVA